MVKQKNKMEENLKTLPNAQYEKLFEKFNEIETLNVADWTTSHVLGFFCKSYENHYKTKYKFKFNTSAPSKCLEVFQVKRLSNILSSDPSLLKKYIEWIFSYKVGQAKRRITSISFITNEYTVNEFKNKYLSGKLPTINTSKIDRTMELPKNVFDILNSKGFSAKTYGDFAFLKSAFGKSSPKFSEAMAEIISVGFDVSVLDGVV